MLHIHCGRVIKFRNRMSLPKTFWRHIDFWDKGKAEENVYYLKESREKLRKLRQQIMKMETSLEESIKALETLSDADTKKFLEELKSKDKKK